MRIRVNFMGLQRAITGTDQVHLTLAEGARLSEAICQIAQSYPDLSLSDDSVLVAVNNEVAKKDGVLAAEDTVSFLPFIGGG